jgi:hypothetical protein
MKNIKMEMVNEVWGGGGNKTELMWGKGCKRNWEKLEHG